MLSSRRCIKGWFEDSLKPFCLHVQNERLTSNDEASTSGGAGDVEPTASRSISSLSTADWQAQHEADGFVDLWVEEEFNSGSRLMVSHSSPNPP